VLKMELDMVRAWVTTRVLAMRADDPDRGNNSADTVIWIAVIAAAAIAIGAVIVIKLMDKANSINLQ
jgi:hypothetical protein